MASADPLILPLRPSWQGYKTGWGGTYIIGSLFVMCVAAHKKTCLIPWNVVGPQLRNLQSKHLFRISYLLAHAQACNDKAYIRATSLSQVLSLVKGLLAHFFDQPLWNYDIFLTSFSYLSVVVISLLCPFASLSICLLVFLSIFLCVFLSGLANLSSS